MNKTHTLIFFTVLWLTACSSLTCHHGNLLNNLYSHQWIKSSEPHIELNVSDVSRFLGDFDVVFFGEFHEHPGIHLAQMELLQAMVSRNPNLTLSLEQFERDTQTYLDDYLAGEIGESYLLDKARAWSNYTTSYRPLVEYARRKQLPVMAANAPRNTVICVGRNGLDYLNRLPAEERKHVARDIDVSAGAYRDKFMAFLHNSSAHGAGHGKQASEEMQKMSEQSFAAQAVRDDTMAETIARHIKQNPQRQVLHLNGSFHSDSFLGAVERLKSRMPELKIAVIHPLEIEDDGEEQTGSERDKGDILLLVEQLPEQFIQQNHKQQWSIKILNKRLNSTISCEQNKL